MSPQTVSEIQFTGAQRLSFGCHLLLACSTSLSRNTHSLDLLAVQETLKSFLHHHSLKASIFQCSTFFMVQLPHLYMTTEKTIALTRQTFAGKVISLLSNLLSRLVIAFLPRSKRLLISWLQPPSAVILEPKKIKSATVSTFPISPEILHTP